MVKHYKISISGKVQGVFFRKSASKKAKELGVAGIVLNKPEGSVYIEAEAEEAVLGEFIVWCKRGPIGAKVEDVNIFEGDLVNYDQFEIIRSNNS
ncbi:MAG: acylphosphatase [Bacteroidetes bacterium]|nr:acylphosphatase [Bacteroidota bacterium]HET6245329.1 acylphosphatase [Bacteroidia bacterium]